MLDLSEAMKRTCVLAGCVAVGCTADLQRVHTPDLLSITERAALRAAPGRPGRRFRSSIPDRTRWQVHASLAEPDAMLDGVPDTAATGNDPRAKDQYILVDLGRMVKVHQVDQLHVPLDGYPLRYRIDTAGEHNFPYALAFVGRGAPGQSSAILHKPVRCRFLRITLLDVSVHSWSVGELEIH